MSKAEQQFTAWYISIRVPDEVMNALKEECAKIDKAFLDHVLWEYNHDEINELTLAETLANYLVEDEQFKQMIES